MADATRIADLIAPAAEGMGFELVRVRFTGGQRRPTLQIMAERPDGTMTVEDCEILSKTVSAVLDVEDPIDGEYVLEVSSPGIDRPLTRLKDFTGAIGHEVKAETKQPVNGRKHYRGPITAVDGEIITIAVDGVGHQVPFSAIGSAKLTLSEALVAESLKKSAARKKAEQNSAQQNNAALQQGDWFDGDPSSN